MAYAQLYTTTNFTFLTGASHPSEYVYRAVELGYRALAITDECSLAGIVKAHAALHEIYPERRAQHKQKLPVPDDELKLIIGSRFRLSNGVQLIAIAPTRTAYAELSGFITLARRRAEKGEYEAHFDDLRFRLQHCLIIWLGQQSDAQLDHQLVMHELYSAFKQRLWIGIDFQLRSGEHDNFQAWFQLGQLKKIPLVACGEALMHNRDRKPLQDTLTAIRLTQPLAALGTQLQSNGEAYLKREEQLVKLYPQRLLDETKKIAALCELDLNDLRYQYPRELVPEPYTPNQYLRALVKNGKHQRWPGGVPDDVENLLEKELGLIEELEYEYYFLTVYDIVQYARQQHILCQGRGSAANSVVCYCLFITEIKPGEIQVLFERFISKERDEPPDIDVDFEHSRREEVIQYIYRKYGRERAALAATVITYRSRSAVRDVGKALGMELSLIDFLAKSIAWWDKPDDLQARIEAAGLQSQQHLLQLFFLLVAQIRGFPRHLSQHVGGFVISQDKVSDLVPLENASMPERTIIQWDKEDLETMRLLKVDVLALGMLTALRKGMEYVRTYEPWLTSLSDIPRDDKPTYQMLCAGDSIGVFQVESRAQMSMLPRLQPRCFYDLVIQIAIVRPGPIQGGMVHPYLRRRHHLEPVEYPSETIKSVLKETLGIPIFQEQVIRLAMVAAGFTGGEADQLRRSMASWGKNSTLLRFETKFIQGMLANGYECDFAQRLFEQIKGFGGYGFPESHSASFALLCYASSWLKCHHPAAFYCALLNSQPMGFYSPSQLIQDARRHGIKVFPVDINRSRFEYHLERLDPAAPVFAIRVGFCAVKGLDQHKAQLLETWRGSTPFASVKNLARRTQLSTRDIECLASADALHSIAGNRHEARWAAAAIEAYSPLLDIADGNDDQLVTPAPTIEKDVMDDYATTGLSLRAHPMALLRNEYPFNRCTRQCDLKYIRHGGFVRVAGLVTGRQRPGTANGTIFVTLEDETGNMNIVVWRNTQEIFRQPLLTSRLMLIKGVLEKNEDNVSQPVIHIVAGQLLDYSERLEQLLLKSRDFH